LNKPQSCDLAHVVLEIHQELGEPRGVVPDVKPPDQRGPVGVGALEDVQLFPCRRFTECGDHSLSDVLAHSTTLEVRTVPYSTTTLTLGHYIVSPTLASTHSRIRGCRWFRVRAAMRRNHRLIRLMITWAMSTALVVIAGFPAYACVCAGPMAMEWIDESDGAFVGTVTDVVGDGGGNTVAGATFRVESVVKGSFGSLVDVRGTDTSCALELEVGQRTGMLLTEDPNEGWWAHLCGQVPAEDLLSAAPTISAPISEVTPIGARQTEASFPWWLIALAVGIVIAGSTIVVVRRRQPVH
jgi:hypothetical protein